MTEDERRDYAREMILKRARVFSVDVEMWARELVGHELDDDVIAVHELIKSAAIVVMWPDDAANVGGPSDAAEEGQSTRHE